MLATIIMILASIHYSCFYTFLIILIFLKVLNDISVDGFVQYIKENKCKNIITLAGAGISTCK